MLDLNDVVRIVATWDMPESTIAQLVWHYLVTSGNNEDPDDALDDIVTNTETAWANIDGMVSDEVVFSDIEMFQYDFGNHEWNSVAQVLSATLDGTNAIDMLPHGCAMLVKPFTEKARRQGRKYLPGIAENQQVDGVIPAGGVTLLALFGADFDDPITAPLAVLTYGTFNVDPASALYETFSKSVQTTQAEGVVAYQRRRRPGTGL